MFICNHCPYVKFILNEIINGTKEYTKIVVKFIAISSNEVGKYP